MNSGNGIVTSLVVGFYNTYIAILANPPAGTMTSGRARSLVAVGVGLISLIIGVVARARGPRHRDGNSRAGGAVAGVGLISLIIGVVARARARRNRDGNSRTGAIVAVVVGLIGIVLSVVHLATYTGGFGTGSGRAGAIVGLVLALIGITLGGLALARSRRSVSVE